MKEIELLQPPDGARTEPLQKHVWPAQTQADDADAAGVQPPVDWRNLQVLAPDRSLPLPVRLQWNRPPAAVGPLSYSVAVGRQRNLSDARILKVIGRSGVDVWHLHLGMRYYWKVSALRFGRVVAESRVWSFRTHPEPPRWIKVPGITNVRDIGGWPLANGRLIRQGLIYRGSEMSGSLCITGRGKRVLEDELGIRTDLDLRGHDESSPALDRDKVEWINIPIAPYGSIGDDAFKEGYRKVFEVLADAARYPIIFHCVGGADRGGTVAFLLNALLGKSKELLFRDYELTSLSIWGERSCLSDAFNGLLTTLAAYGGAADIVQVQVEAYIRAIGVAPGTIAAIRAQLTADPEP